VEEEEKMEKYAPGYVKGHERKKAKTGQQFWDQQTQRGVQIRQTCLVKSIKHTGN
jgi:hypothetical protein